MSDYKTNVHYALDIPCETVELSGFLYLPEGAKGIVLFAHGSGSSRHSKRNNQVARALNQGGLGTLLFDLLTPQEEAVDKYTREFRFNIPLLASRLVEVSLWYQHDVDKPLSIGYFGSSTGGGAALIAAAMRPELVNAVVSRGGRPDLAGEYLPLVKAPTLLLVGGFDEAVIEMNRKAMGEMTCEVQLDIIPEASHLFEEPGKLETVAEKTKNWFIEWL